MRRAFALLLFALSACGPTPRNLGSPAGPWKEQDMKGEAPLGLSAQMPEAGEGAFSVLVANVGNSDLFHCGGPAMFKLCQVASERAVAQRLLALKPDVAVLSEVLAPWQCEKVGEVDERHVCHPSHTAGEPEQVRRLLGPDYTIACDDRGGFECVAVRRGFARIVGCGEGKLCRGLSRTAPPVADCDLGTGLAPVQPEYFTVSAVTLELDGREVDVLNAHPPAVLNEKAAACRVKFLRALLEPKGTEGSLRRAPLALLGGDFNFDPYRGAPEDPDVAYWRTRVRPDLDGQGGPFALHSGAIEHDPPYWTAELVRRTLDHAASEGFQGRCRTLGAAPKHPSLDMDTGAELDRLDHRSLYCVLSRRG